METVNSISRKRKNNLLSQIYELLPNNIYYLYFLQIIDVICCLQLIFS